MIAESGSFESQEGSADTSLVVKIESDKDSSDSESTSEEEKQPKPKRRLILGIITAFIAGYDVNRFI